MSQTHVRVEDPVGWGLRGDVARAAMEADFLALPRMSSANAAIQAATTLGAEHVDVRITRTRSRVITSRDARRAGSNQESDTGIGVRVLVDGVWGFASGDSLADAADWGAKAVAMARMSAPSAAARVVLADEPVHSDQAWASPTVVDPFEVSDEEILEVLNARSAQLLSSRKVQHADGEVSAARDLTYYADSAGTSTLSQRTRIESKITAVHVGDGDFEDMCTVAPPTARGWEYVVGDDAWNWTDEIAALPDLLAEKVRAPSVEPGRYDLVIDPTNLWLTIHESVGHATELDRALGYEANYAGTSFASLDGLGSFRYGSELMNVTGDRISPFGLSTVGFDDEGVAAQMWDLVRAGVHTGFQLDRRMAAEQGFTRSNGCAFADSAHHVQIQRMPNVSLAPDPQGPDLDALIGGVSDGIYVVGDKSWSIDMARYNFQFTGQRFFRIRAGRLAGQVKDVAYQGRTPQFWGGLVALGGPQTHLAGGALNCGKGQPGQVAAVSHGCPAAVFAGVNVLNTTSEAHA